MRQLKEISERIPFEDYEVFETPTSVLREADDLISIADKELIVNSNQELYVKVNGELKPIKIKQ